MCFTLEESHFALTSWETFMGLYEQLSLNCSGGHFLSFVPAELWVGTRVLPERECKPEQVALCLSSTAGLPQLPERRVIVTVHILVMLKHTA